MDEQGKTEQSVANQSKAKQKLRFSFFLMLRVYFLLILLVGVTVWSWEARRQGLKKQERLRKQVNELMFSGKEEEMLKLLDESNNSAFVAGIFAISVGVFIVLVFLVLFTKAKRSPAKTA